MKGEGPSARFDIAFAFTLRSLSVPPSLYLLPYEQSAPRHSRGHLRGANGRTGWTGRKSVRRHADGGRGKLPNGRREACTTP